MARSKSGKNNTSGTRVPMGTLSLGLRSRSPLGDTLSLIQDLRRFSFEPDTQPARNTYGATASTVASTPQKQNQSRRSRVPYQLAFSAPAETLVCIRRKRRKEILFAKKKTGKAGQKKSRWSKWSNYKCR